MDRKVVYNACYGGFGLSPLAIKKLYEMKHPGEIIYFYIQTGYGFLREDGMDIFERVDNLEAVSDTFDTYCCNHNFGKHVEILHEKRKTNENIYGSIIYMLDVERHDPDLIKVVEELGSIKASGLCSKLEIVDIGDSLYHIEKYDGFESVITKLDNDYWV